MKSTSVAVEEEKEEEAMLLILMLCEYNGLGGGEVECVEEGLEISKKAGWCCCRPIEAVCVAESR